MARKKKIVLNWSGGKDSSITLQRLSKDESVSVDRLLVSLNKSTNRVSMHGVRKKLIERQSELLGIPVTFMELPENASMDDYNRIMAETMNGLMDEGYTHSAFGDIFLEDLREYREKQLQKIGIKPLFPIWKEDTTKLAHSFIDDGFKASFVCIDKSLPISKYAGKEFSKAFLEELSGDIDPCGENGEFHTFVCDGPIFSKPIPYQKGEIIDKKYPSPEGEGEKVFRFCDLIL